MSVIQWTLLLVLSTSYQQAFCQNDNNFIKAANCFSVELMKRIKTDDGNVIASGFSVDAVLSMLLFGAGGQTKDELNAVLQNTAIGVSSDDVKKGFSSAIQKLTSNQNVTVSIANAMWVEQTFTVRDDYKKLINESFQAEERSGDFQTKAKETTNDINAWVKEKTKALIEKLFDKPLDASTIMVLLNAIYFKGKWLKPFDPANTESQPFYNFDNSKTTVPLMNQKNTFGYKEDENTEAKFLRMDYSGQTMSFIAVLPKEGESLDDFEKGLTCATIEDVLDIKYNREVTVTIPKFDVTSNLDLEKPLKGMGLNAIFGNADLSGIAKGNLQLTKIVQKARIKLSEEGTEAAAVTGGVVGLTAVREPLTFVANHPFYYFIVEKSTGLILFSGKLNKL